MVLKRRLGPPVVVVSGLPRSGTSMMMAMLRAGGMALVTDAARAADEDNPRGYHEDERVKALDTTQDKSWLRDCRGKAVKIISFLLKDLPDDCYYKVIFMQRDLEEVVASQNKMLARRGEQADGSDDSRMMRNYRSHVRKVEALVGDRPNLEWLEVRHREVLDDPARQARRVARFVGGRLDLAAMAAAVDRQLYRNRRERQGAQTG
jgi:hypothetical protein